MIRLIKEHALKIRTLISLMLLSTTFIMIAAYSWLLEANLESGVLFSSEVRLNRAADTWIESINNATSPSANNELTGPKELTLLPPDGTPVLYSHKENLPAELIKQLPNTLTDGQFTAIGTNEIGLLYKGHLVHLYRLKSNGEGIHVVQRLVLSPHEYNRVIPFDDKVNKRLYSRWWFLGGVIFILWLFGRRITKANTTLLKWSDSLSVEELPDKPPKLPFTELQLIADRLLLAFRREKDVLEQRHRFLRFTSHELRTPLATASANAELLTRHGVPAGGEDAMKRLNIALNRMSNLTNTLLWLGRGEAPIPEPEPVDLLGLVTNIVDAHRELANDNSVVVEIVPSTIKQVVLPRALIDIVCANLIENAIRHTRDGRVDIHLTQKSIKIENRGSQLGGKVANGNGFGIGLQLVAWVIESTGWQLDKGGSKTFRYHRVSFTPKEV